MLLFFLVLSHVLHCCHLLKLGVSQLIAVARVRRLVETEAAAPLILTGFHVFFNQPAEHKFNILVVLGILDVLLQHVKRL